MADAWPWAQNRRMSTRPDEPADADPTHALDDFLRRMRPATPAAPADDGDPTDLSALTARLHPERPATAARPKGGTLRNGERWQADDVTDVPVVELPRVPLTTSAPADDDALLHDIGRGASAAAAAAADAAAQARADWQPDPQALQLRPATDPRLLPRWQPGAWIGAQRLVLQPSTEFVTPAGAAPGSPPVVESYEAQRLLLLWAPPDADTPQPGRWPRQVLLAPVSAQAAAGALLAARPADAAEAPLWMHAEPDSIDWALAAEIALHHVPGLRPFQVDGLRAFIAAEREASFARVNDGYGAVPGGALAKAG